jgi:hypothetical protein
MAETSGATAVSGAASDKYGEMPPVFQKLSSPRGPRREPAPHPHKPDCGSIHAQHAGGKLNHFPAENVAAKFRDPPPEKPATNFVPLDPVESVRYDDEVQAMKNKSLEAGWDAESRYFAHMEASVVHEEGCSPRDLTKQRVDERLGIHQVSFRPVTTAGNKTFDDYRDLAKRWREQMGLPDADPYNPPPSNARTVDRPSVIGDYVNSGAPIVSRSGSQLTSVNRERRARAEANRKPEPHLVASYYADDFQHGPGSDNPAPGFKHAKACYAKEREVVERLVQRLQGKGSYSPQRMDNLSVPLTPEARAAKAEEAERSRSRHTDPGSVSSMISSVSRARNSVEGPKRPVFWR